MNQSTACVPKARELPEGWRWADAAALAGEVALPSAFQAFRGFLDAVQCDGKAVVVTSELNQNVVLSARNIPGVVTTTARILSVYDIVNAKQLVIDKAALAIIEEVYA